MEATEPMLLGMFVTLAALIVGSIWNQHRESNATRAETTRQIERLSDQLGALSEGLSSVRERLGRVEGYLRLAPPPADDPPEGDNRGGLD